LLYSHCTCTVSLRKGVYVAIAVNTTFFL